MPDQTQICPHCHREMPYRQRYPSYLCRDCASKPKHDAGGNLLEFFNQSASGGFLIIRKDGNGNIIEEDFDKDYADCLIEGKWYTAQEEYMGGVVIQPQR